MIRRIAGFFFVFMGCAAPLVQTPPPPFYPDVPGGETFPEGTRGVVVARDTLWAGPLRWRPGTLMVDTLVLRIKDVRCLSYRFPPSWHPSSLTLEGIVGAGLGIALALPVIGFLSSLCPTNGCMELMFIAPLLVIPSVMGSLWMVHYSLGYPRKRLQQHLYRYALVKDPPWPDRCAALLHFYNPLLDSTGTFVIPLR